MANSVGRIYNATLGSSQLESDGEHTLFTTDSSTSRIIKEVKFDLGAGVTLKGAYLEVNGHNVASISDSGTALTGEIIVPPNSTVKIKAPNTYPVAFYKEYEQTISPSRYLYVNTLVRDQTTGTVTTTLTQNKSQNLTSTDNANNYIDLVDARGFAIRPPGNHNSVFQPFYFMSAIYHDGNSVQQIKMHTAQDYGEYQTSGYPIHAQDKVYANYKGFAFDRDITRSMHTFTGSGGNQAVLNTIDIESNRFKVRGSLNTAELNNVDFTKWNSVANSSPATSHGQFSPQPTSSYPRAHCIGDWYFWIPQNGYPDRVYGVSLKTGQMFHFQNMSSWASSGNRDFTVSIDTANDKFVFWRPASSTVIYRATTNDTISDLEAVTSGGVPNAPVTNASNISFNGGNYADYSFGSCQLSDRMDGGFGYKNQSNQHVACDYDGAVIYTHSTFSGLDNFTPSNTHLWKRTMGKMSASEISSAGISQPTFDISVFGYTAS